MNGRAGGQAGERASERTVSKRVLPECSETSMHAGRRSPTFSLTLVAKSLCFMPNSWRAVCMALPTSGEMVLGGAGSSLPVMMHVRVRGRDQ